MLGQPVQLPLDSDAGHSGQAGDDCGRFALEVQLHDVRFFLRSTGQGCSTLFSSSCWWYRLVIFVPGASRLPSPRAFSFIWSIAQSSMERAMFVGYAQELLGSSAPVYMRLFLSNDMGSPCGGGDSSSRCHSVIRPTLLTSCSFGPLRPVCHAAALKTLRPGCRRSRLTFAQRSGAQSPALPRLVPLARRMAPGFCHTIRAAVAGAVMVVAGGRLGAVDVHSVAGAVDYQIWAVHCASPISSTPSPERRRLSSGRPGPGR